MSKFKKNNDLVQIRSKDKSKSTFSVATNEKKLNLDAKKSYHQQGLDQSKWGFWLSVGGAIAGFIVIVISLIWLDEKSNLGVISGIVIETVSVLFYSISNNASKRMVEFFDKLRLDSNTVSALEVAKSIDDSNIKDELKVKLSLFLIGIKEENICNKTRSVCKKNEPNEAEKQQSII